MSVKEQIDIELKYLTNAIHDDRSKLSKELQKLRSLIMVIHLDIEIRLDDLIALYITDPFLRHKTHDQRIKMISENIWAQKRVDELTTDMNFTKKISFLKKVGIFKSKNEVVLKIKRVNDLRNIFSHPNNYSNIIVALKNEENYLKALKSLHEGYESLDNFYWKFTGIDL